MTRAASTGDGRFFGDADLARRLEFAQAALNAAFARSLAEMQPDSGARALAPASGGAAVLVPGFQPLSQAVGLGLAGPVSGAELDEIEELYRAADLCARIIVSPLADPTLIELLGVRGYRVVEFENLLVRSLDAGEQFPRPPTELTVHEAAPDQLDALAGVVARGFVEGADPSPEMCRIFTASARSPHHRCFGVWIDGAPVAGGVSGVQDRILALCGAATLPAYRRHGAQHALTYARLSAAAQAGCDAAMIMTQPGSGSQRNAERIGFRPLYTKVALHRAWRG